MIARDTINIAEHVYRLRDLQYPVHVYVSLRANNSFSVARGSKTPNNETRVMINPCDDITGHCEAMYVDGYFSIVITLGFYNSYFKTKDELLPIIVHEIQHAIGDIYNRIDESFSGNEHDAYLAQYLFSEILHVFEMEKDVMSIMNNINNITNDIPLESN